MLAAPRPPALTVGCFKFQNPSANVNLVQRNVGSSNCKRVVVAAKATYSRVPLDTPGAYQLIDEDTGEKFIVWGSAEDDSSNSPIPSNEVLSWKPLPSPNNNNNDNDSTINQASNRGSTGNFGRLKFRRMRDLVRKSYTKNKKRDVIEHDEHNVTNTSSQSSTSSYGELDQLKEKQKLSARALAKIQQLESRKNSPKIIRMEDEGYNGDFDAEFGRLVDSRSKASASSLRGWGRGQSIHDRSMGEEISRRRQNLDDRNNFFSRKSFHDMGCSDYMIEALRNQHFVRPSHIQSLTFEPIMAGKSCIVSDQSGSGKTLAYLLPLIQRLRQEELQGLSKPSPQSPRVVILAPTTELASQVLNTCRSFSKSGVPFRSMVVTGGFRQRTQLENLRQELDVLIATPGRFMFLIKEGYLQLTNLKCAVLDEVDILFNDEDFETAFQCLINSSPIITQYLFVTATLPMDIYNKLVESFPDCELVTGPGMHRTSPGLEETTSQERDMMKHLLAMMTNLCQKVEKIETEVQNLKANSQQHDSKHAELGQQHDQKHAKLQGDVGKLQKTHNNICSNAATASTSTAGQSAKKEEAKVKYTNINMNRLFSKPYTPQNTQKDISTTPQTNTYKASLESQKQTYSYISRTYIENIYKVQTFLNQNPRAKNTKNPNENYVTQYLQGYNKLIAPPGTNPNLIATCYNYGLLSTVYTVTGDEISKIPELYKAFLQYKRVTKGTLFYIKIYGRILYDEVKPTIQVIKIGLTREMIIPEKIDTQEEIQKVDIPEFYANKRIIGIATILNEITNNYLNENAIWTYYNRDQTIIYSNCRDIREADMEKLRQWILSLLRPETMPTTRAIRKNFISSNLMTRYCKLIGQKYPDHLCSKCEGEKNYIPDVQLE